MDHMLCAKFGWKCPSGSGEEDLKSYKKCIFTMLLLSSLWEGHESPFEKSYFIFFIKTC